MTLAVNEVVRVSASISPTGLLRRDFGRTLFLTTNDLITPNERVRVYASASALAADFPVGSAPRVAGEIYFSQSPFPKNLVVGRWVDSIEAAYLQGGAPLAVSDLDDITDGSFTIAVDLTTGYDTPATTEYAISGLDFSTVVSFADAAVIIQAALVTAFAGNGFDAVTVEYNATAGGFRISIPADDPLTIVTVGYATAGAVGTDVSTSLALTSTTATKISSSTIVETAVEALDAIEQKDASFYFITTENGTINDQQEAEDISAWAEARVYMYSAESSDPTTLIGGNTVFKRLSDLAPDRTFGTWSATDDYKGVSAAGRLSSVNFNATNSLITMKFKDLPGTLPDTNLPETQAEQLQAQAANFYSERSGVPMYEEGYCFDKNVWIDVRYWLDWFVNAVQVELFNVLKSSPTKIPQTEEGMSTLKRAVNNICEQGRKNGGIASGQLSPALTLDVQQSTGNGAFDGFLSGGYLVFAEPIALFPQSERAQRKVPPLKVWLKGSGAIHFVDVIITFEN